MMTRKDSMIFHRSISILTIDDDKDILESITTILEMEGYDTLSASNGLDALKILDKLEDFELPSLILLDYTMPGFNGKDFYNEFSKIDRYKKIPVVLMTANSNIREIMDQLDAEAFISKPMDMQNILNVARNFTERRTNARYSFLA